MGRTKKEGRVLRNLEIIYWSAFNDKKWRVALEIAMLRSKLIEVVDKQRFPQLKRVSEMSIEELEDFIAALERHDPEFKEVIQRPPEEKKPPDPQSPPPYVERLSYE